MLATRDTHQVSLHMLLYIYIALYAKLLLSAAEEELEEEEEEESEAAAGPSSQVEPVQQQPPPPPSQNLPPQQSAPPVPAIPPQPPVPSFPQLMNPTASFQAPGEVAPHFPPRGVPNSQPRLPPFSQPSGIPFRGGVRPPIGRGEPQQSVPQQIQHMPPPVMGGAPRSMGPPMGSIPHSMAPPMGGGPHSMPPHSMASSMGGGPHSMPPHSMASSMGGGPHSMPPHSMAPSMGGGPHSMPPLMGCVPQHPNLPPMPQYTQPYQPQMPPQAPHGVRSQSTRHQMVPPLAGNVRSFLPHMGTQPPLVSPVSQNFPQLGPPMGGERSAQIRQFLPIGEQPRGGRPMAPHMGEGPRRSFAHQPPLPPFMHQGEQNMTKPDNQLPVGLGQLPPQEDSLLEPVPMDEEESTEPIPMEEEPKDPEAEEPKEPKSTTEDVKQPLPERKEPFPPTMGEEPKPLMPPPVGEEPKEPTPPPMDKASEEPMVPPVGEEPKEPKDVHLNKVGLLVSPATVANRVPVPDDVPTERRETTGEPNNDNTLLQEPKGSNGSMEPLPNQSQLPGTNQLPTGEDRQPETKGGGPLETTLEDPKPPPKYNTAPQVTNLEPKSKEPASEANRPKNSIFSEDEMHINTADDEFRIAMATDDSDFL